MTHPKKCSLCGMEGHTRWNTKFHAKNDSDTESDINSDVASNTSDCENNDEKKLLKNKPLNDSKPTGEEEEVMSKRSLAQCENTDVGVDSGIEANDNTLLHLSEDEESCESDSEVVTSSFCKDDQDKYTEDILKSQFNNWLTWMRTQIDLKELGLITRVGAGMPEHISENMIKFILQNKCDDASCTWRCSGDLISKKEGKQECKCFISDGPLSFGPTCKWNYIYFLDARQYLANKFTLYKIKLSNTSDQWKSIKVKKNQSYEDQCKQGRRPRIGWKSLNPQIKDFTEIVFEGSFEDIFTQPSQSPSQSQTQIESQTVKASDI